MSICILHQNALSCGNKDMDGSSILKVIDFSKGESIQEKNRAKVLHNHNNCPGWSCHLTHKWDIAVFSISIVMKTQKQKLSKHLLFIFWGWSYFLTSEKDN